MVFWKISDLVVNQPPGFVRVTTQKFRNRHFYMDPAALDSGELAVPKRCSLYSTADFFIRSLTSSDYTQLKETAMSLNGCRVRVGTTCSGSDIGIIALKSLLRAINKEFNATWILGTF